MTLKIKYLDGKKGSLKNNAIILAKESKISDFKGIFDDKTNQKSLLQKKVCYQKKEMIFI